MPFSKGTADLLTAQQEAMAEWRYLHETIRESRGIDPATEEQLTTARAIAMALTQQAFAIMAEEVVLSSPFSTAHYPIENSWE